MESFIFEHDGELIIGNIMNEVENVDPKIFLTEFYAKSLYPAIKCMFLKVGISNEEFCVSYANKQSALEISKSESLEIPENIKKILQEEHSKKEQVALLHGIEISDGQLEAAFLFAGKCGYSFSNYRYEKPENRYEYVPPFIYLKDDNSVESVGPTQLSDGQLKDIVLSSNFIIARILDNGTHWHSFFQTRRGVMGKESGKYGTQSHLHYISDAFGISREDFVKEIKSGHYHNTPVHILLTDSKKSSDTQSNNA